jgi:hypothetical protein
MQYYEGRKREGGKHVAQEKNVSLIDHIKILRGEIGERERERGMTSSFSVTYLD